MEANIDEMLQTKLSLSSVSVVGATRTSQTLLDRITAPVLSTGGSFASVVEDVSKAVDLLRATGCYRGVDAYLDSAPHSSARAVLTLTEKSLFQLHTGAQIATTGSERRDPSLEASFAWRNVSGHADSLRAAASWLGGSAGESIAALPSSKFELSYARPFALALSCGLSARASSALHNYEHNSSHCLGLKAVSVAADHMLGRLALNVDWRDVSRVSTGASPAILQDAGHSLKVSVSETIDVDSRDSARMPTSGSYLSVAAEATLPAGDVSFRKLSVAHQLHIPLGTSGIAFALCARAGALITPVSSSSKQSSIVDRFYLGGPTSFRGFSTRGVGPRDLDDSIGGDVYYALSAMLSAPLPEGSLLAQMFGARVHAFATAGELTDVQSARQTATAWRGHKSVKDKAKAMWNAVYDPMRISAGLGVAMDTPLGRVELNYCHIVRSASSDLSSSFQIGISESFS